MDAAGARYLSSSQGRFTSVDPSNLSTFFTDPQSWNRYAYANNSPLKFVDKNGMWPTAIHERIIDSAFARLTGQQREILKEVSKHQDALISGQGNSRAPEHAMRGPGIDAGVAQVRYYEFINTSMDKATRTQIQFWESGNPALSNGALSSFALALHAIVDSTSPGHSGFQLWNWSNLWADWQHKQNEKSISPQQFNQAVKEAQDAFTRAFGSDVWLRPSIQSFINFGRPAEPRSSGEPKGGADSKICYTIDGQKVCP